MPSSSVDTNNNVKKIKNEDTDTLTDDSIITTTEARIILKVSHHYVWRLFSTGSINAKKHGGIWITTYKELKKYLESRKPRKRG